MIGKASSLGCQSGSDLSCLCGKQDFKYGIRDCATEACGSDAPTIIAFGDQFCAGAGGSGVATTVVSKACVWVDQTAAHSTNLPPQ
jgi:hypothetical protein